MKPPAESSFARVLTLIREAENRLINNAGQTNPVDRVSTLRGIYYGTLWSLDYKVESKRSEPGARIRNLGFLTYTGGNMPPDPRPALGAQLFNDLQANQSVKDGPLGIDIGHVLIGLETRASLPLRTAPMPGQGGTALEIVTWLGDLGGGAASLARRRIAAPSTSVGTIFHNNSSDYGVMDNLEGDAGGYLVAASTPGGAPIYGSGTAVADALARYLPIRSDAEWRTRAARFAQALGATVSAAGIANKTAMIDRLANKMYDFAVWYTVTRWIPWGELKGNKAIAACSHMKGAAREVATVFVDTLGRAIAGKGPLQAAPPYPQPSVAGSCSSLLLRGAAFDLGVVRKQLGAWPREGSGADESGELHEPAGEFAAGCASCGLGVQAESPSVQSEHTAARTLHSARFAGDETLTAVLNGKLRLAAVGTSPHPAPVLSSGPSIAKIQRALIDLRYPLPRYGSDGKFGSETGTAVVKFKTRHGIRPNDPVVEPKTMAALDDAITAMDKGRPKPQPTLRNWFTGDTTTGMSRALHGSRVSFLIDAEEFYSDLRREVTDAAEQRRNGFVCWAGFEVSGTTPMPSSHTPAHLKPFAPREWQEGDRAWLDVLASATNQGVLLRALLNLHPHPRSAKYKEANFDTVAKLNSLKNTLAINDFRYLFMNGTHHQKLVIVHNDAGLTGYVGTMDIHPKRIGDRWCEVQCKVRGEAARELYRVFYDRWQEHTAMLAGQPRERGWLPRPEDLGMTSGGSTVSQISTTFGSPQHANPFLLPGNPPRQVVNQPHRVIIGPIPFGNDFFTGKDRAAPPLIAAARKQAAEYLFARNGHTGIYHQIKAALNHRPRFIYMEDQYLVDDLPMGQLASMLTLLEQRVRDPVFGKLVIFCTRIHEIDGPDEFQGLAAAHRRAFVERLVAAGGDRVVVCQYKSNAALGLSGQWKRDPQNSPFYIHSKTWIFDDELAIIGSANCNRRGYSHDSELDFGVYDPRTSAIRDLRSRLWLRRLNTEAVKKPLTPVDIRDFGSAARYWERPAEFGLTIENHRIGLDAFIPVPRVSPHSGDMDLYAPLMSAIGPAAADVRERLMWDYVADPEGTCAKCAPLDAKREAEVSMMAGVST